MEEQKMDLAEQRAFFEKDVRAIQEAVRD